MDSLIQGLLAGPPTSSRRVRWSTKFATLPPRGVLTSPNPIEANTLSDSDLLRLSQKFVTHLMCLNQPTQFVNIIALGNEPQIPIHTTASHVVTPEDRAKPEQSTFGAEAPRVRLIVKFPKRSDVESKAVSGDGQVGRQPNESSISSKSRSFQSSASPSLPVASQSRQIGDREENGRLEASVNGQAGEDCAGLDGAKVEESEKAVGRQSPPPQSRRNERARGPVDSPGAGSKTKNTTQAVEGKGDGRSKTEHTGGVWQANVTKQDLLWPESGMGAVPKTKRRKKEFEMA
ncbi:hypothetical protein M427DRAFT_42767 [Gonapodya prolifera JEL478]|uniref:Uncharacterized protein n=1 Tax=Gonapodya prolifera (strain JEL478) TaxID=1344416 RepID=A0A139AMN7_GONPJ|nr:hypothetical protein M427DRAFT_42767 [Gonapodya prolifera JEL478]|eukprot:KXS18030.1 hypothetical protein M427DRAFT_42767 [Gonapodya prolifera JEL478]